MQLSVSITNRRCASSSVVPTATTIALASSRFLFVSSSSLPLPAASGPTRRGATPTRIAFSCHRVPPRERRVRRARSDKVWPPWHPQKILDCEVVSIKQADWDANLAAVIKCADASLEQQFRQFADVTDDLATYSGFSSTASPAGAPCDGPVRTRDGRGGFAPHFQPLDSIFVGDDSGSNNIGTTYFRESMMAANRARFRAAREDLGDGDRESASARTSSSPFVYFPVNQSN
ncbi:hypothetical protein PybrP1_001202 [[Pythium] brassicae (nom. inval.)]|nr:hypothetical protein PybrP1_001202 [[Pythium] brassicae (nom. inval.)]